MWLFDKFKRKIPPMVQIFYNQDFGFLIVPNAVEKTMGCHISIEPTEKIMPDCSSDDLGNAVIRAIKIAKNYKNNDSIIVNLSGRGDKDIEILNWGKKGTDPFFPHICRKKKKWGERFFLNFKYKYDTKII